MSLSTTLVIALILDAGVMCDRSKRHRSCSLLLGPLTVLKRSRLQKHVRAYRTSPDPASP